MHSRATRLFVSTLIWLAFLASAGFIYYTEQQLAARRTTLRTFDAHAREASDALADLRAGQEAYVAAGQGASFWIPKVATTTDVATAAVDTARQFCSSSAGLMAMKSAAASITHFSDVDKHARDYVGSNELLMAGDVIFTEGGQAATAAVRQVQAASAAEHTALDAFEANQRLLEVYGLAAAGILGALATLVLALSSPTRTVEEPAVEMSSPSPAVLPREELPALKSAATLCTEFGRVRHLEDLTALLGRAAEAMEASGLILWIGNTRGADLRPVVAHGYPAQSLARMPAVPRAADNAAAAAYRSGSLQLVLGRPGTSNGAIVAPLLTPEGCIGALTAEIKGGGETSDSAQALAAIFAAQLAAVLAPTTGAEEVPAERQRAANS